MEQYKYISSISGEELEKAVVISAIDEDKFPCILIKNSAEKVLVAGYSTDNIDIKLNRVLEKDSKNYYFHIIKIKKIDEYNKNQFSIIYDYIFKKIEQPISDLQLANLIISIEDLFKISPEKDLLKFQAGVYGELFTVMYLYKNGYENIVNKYHENFYSKIDIEIIDSLKLEIKTTLSEKRIHHFKNNQICRKDGKVIVASVLLEEAKEGFSLYDLFEFAESIFVDPDLIFSLRKLRIRCNVSEENRGITCSLENANHNIRFYDAISIPKIETAIPDGLTNIEFDSDLKDCKYFDISDLIKLFNS